MSYFFLRTILFILFFSCFEIKAMSPYVLFELTKKEIELIKKNPEQEWVYVPLDINNIFQIIYPNQEMLSIDRFEIVQNKVKLLLTNQKLIFKINQDFFKNVTKFQEDLISRKAILVIQKQIGENEKIIAFLRVL